MNIIIEGPDATGKTTLVEKILVKNNLTTIHGTAKTPNDLPYYLDLLDGNGQIFDRFHFSEYIFPQIYGRMPKLTFNDFELANRWPYSVVAGYFCWDDKPDDYYYKAPEERTYTIMENYEEVFNSKTGNKAGA